MLFIWCRNINKKLIKNADIKVDESAFPLLFKYLAGKVKRGRLKNSANSLLYSQSAEHHYFYFFFCIFTLKWSPQVVRCAITRSSKQLLLIYIFLILHFIFSPVAVVAEMVLGISRLFPQERCPNIWIPNGRPFSSVLSAATSLKITRQIRNF